MFEFSFLAFENVFLVFVLSSPLTFRLPFRVLGIFEIPLSSFEVWPSALGVEGFTFCVFALPFRSFTSLFREPRLPLPVLDIFEIPLPSFGLLLTTLVVGGSLFLVFALPFRVFGLPFRAF